MFINDVSEEKTGNVFINKIIPRNSLFPEATENIRQNNISKWPEKKMKTIRKEKDGVIECSLTKQLENWHSQNFLTSNKLISSYDLQYFNIISEN